MSLRVDISGVKEAERNLKKYVNQKAKQIVDETNKAALNVERGAKKRVRVDTGRLRSSIHAVPTSTVDADTGVQTGKEDAAVVTNVTYAPYNEFGTRFMSAQPFMFPAWEEERPKYIKRMKKILRSL